jgi:hypothetical protein
MTALAESNKVLLGIVLSVAVDMMNGKNHFTACFPVRLAILRFT